MLRQDWPEWLTTAICDAYKSGVAADSIAQTLFRTEGSVRSKLVREGVYISKSTARKQLKEIVREEHGF